ERGENDVVVLESARVVVGRLGKGGVVAAFDADDRGRPRHVAEIELVSREWPAVRIKLDRQGDEAEGGAGHAVRRTGWRGTGNAGPGQDRGHEREEGELHAPPPGSFGRRTANWATASASRRVTRPSSSKSHCEGAASPAATVRATARASSTSTRPSAV